MIFTIAGILVGLVSLNIVQAQDLACGNDCGGAQCIVTADLNVSANEVAGLLGVNNPLRFFNDKALEDYGVFNGGVGINISGDHFLSPEDLKKKTVLQIYSSFDCPVGLENSLTFRFTVGSLSFKPQDSVNRSVTIDLSASDLLNEIKSSGPIPAVHWVAFLKEKFLEPSFFKTAVTGPHSLPQSTVYRVDYSSLGVSEIWELAFRKDSPIVTP